ncbi:hypothetical protein GCM10027399_00660 [Curvibacter fontanus]|jgi:hypothetical protein|nr:hypothetical protein [Burkholderiales bacterium]
MKTLLFLFCCWAGAAQAAEPVLLQMGGLVQHKLALTAQDLRSLQDLRPGPRHVRWLTSVEVLLAPSR